MWDLNYAQNVTNGRNFLLADDLTLSPTTFLQLRYSFTRHYENQGGDPAQNGFDITTLGFPSSLAAEEVYKLLPFVIFTDNNSGIGGTAELQHIPICQRKQRCQRCRDQGPEQARSLGGL